MPSPAVILTEGQADDALFNKLISCRSIANLEVRVAKDSDYGYKNFSKRLLALSVEPGIESRKAVILVADNDGDPSGRFIEIREQVANTGKFNVPDSPRVLSQSGPLPPVSILMLPWDNVPGCLDSMCFDVASKRHQVNTACVAQFVTCVNAQGWEVADLAKLKMRALLSSITKQNPSISLHVALKKDKQDTHFPSTSAEFEGVVAFLNSVARL